MPVWKEVTVGFESSGEARIAWMCKLPGIEVTVVQQVRFDHTNWLLMCKPHLFWRMLLSSRTLEAAKAEALRLVRERCMEIARATEDVT